MEIVNKQQNKKSVDAFTETVLRAYARMINSLSEDCLHELLALLTDDVC